VTEGVVRVRQYFGGMQHSGGEEDKREGEVDVKSEGQKI
jgi:hypothetical protein